MLIATFSVLKAFYHPEWFSYVALLGIPVMSVVAASLVPRRKSAK
jgi:hypothetical protein